MKIRNRIVLLLTVLSASILVILTGFIYFFASRNSYEDFYHRLEMRAAFLTLSHFDSSGAQSSYAHARLKWGDKLPQEQGYILPVTDSPSPIPSLYLPPGFYARVEKQGHVFLQVNDRSYLGQLHTIRNRKYIVIVSAVNEFSKGYLGNLEKLLLAGFFISILLLLALGFVFSRHVLKPVRDITEKVNMISTQNLHLRLPERNGQDEIAQLTSTFNNMLDRLETAFETQKNFVSNASHELNTPLTSIIGEAQLALNKPRSTTEYQTALQVVLSEAERLKHITQSLLSLVQTSFTGDRLQEMEPLLVNELMQNVKKSVEGIYPLSRIVIVNDFNAAGQQLTVNGSMSLLQLAFSNIVQNACKYSNLAPVIVRIHREAALVYITIGDKGVGIPEAEIKHIYDPFFRASNTGAFKGYGIGLPLSRTIIRMHRGEIKIRSVVGRGTEVEVQLPLIASS